MATPFTRTVRSLAADGARGTSIRILVVAALLVAWCAWFTRAEVELYEVSTAARIERAPGPLSVDAPRAGKVVEVRVALGEHVEKGDTLLVIDSSREKLALGEAKEKKSALDDQVGPLEKELDATERALGDSRQAAAGAAGEAKALEKVASAEAKLAESEAARANAMSKEGVASKAEQERALAEAEVKAAGAESATFATRRRAWEHKTGQSDTISRIEGLRRELARVRGEIKTETATVARLENEIEERTVRAAADGRIGDVPGKLRLGAVVDEGEHLVSIVPEGALLAVADFAPATAVGRIHPGQSARVRLHGFPWTTHGMVRARVVRVGSEARDGRVRVELDVEPPSRPLVVLEHGLSGTVEIEVERVTPAELVLRTAGVILAPPPPPPVAAEPAPSRP